MKRCTECRGWFEPAATATGHQRVCGLGCRKNRRAKLARKRRLQADLVAVRDDERERQRKSREARGGARASAAARCHEPASAGKPLISQEEMGQIVDKLVRLSLTSLPREAARLLRRSRGFLVPAGAQDGR